MKGIFNGDNNDLLDDQDDLLGSVSEGDPVILGQFSPWHKPRKQYIREKQWWGCLRDLLSDYEGVPHIGYFGLPGADLLDIDYLAQSIKSSAYSDKKVFAYGIIRTNREVNEAAVRLTSLLHTGVLLKGSKIEHFNFSAVKDRNCIIWDSIKSSGPFHFVNLDFCNSAFTQENLDSMYELMSHQMNHLVGLPWLFCVTTRVDTQGVNADVVKILERVISKIQEENLSWDVICECYQTACELLEEFGSFSDERFPPEEYANICSICFVLWVIRAAFNYQVKVKIPSSMKYKVVDDNPCSDMYSIVFRFEKVEVREQDDFQLAATVAEGHLGEEDKKLMEERAVRKVSSSHDVDIALDGNIELLREYVHKKKELLKRANWDVSTYEQQLCPQLVN